MTAALHSLLEIAIVILRPRAANVGMPPGSVRRLLMIRPAMFPSRVARPVTRALVIASSAVVVVAGETLVIKATAVKTLVLETAMV